MMKTNPSASPVLFPPSNNGPANDHVVVAGNPGVGKSAILNCIIGEIRFQSGISIGKGLTSVLHTQLVNGVKFSDTPGLDDVEIRRKAALEISKAFVEGGRFKLIFVVTLEAGRIKPADMATMDIVLNAIKAVGVNTDFGYSIIVNKCDTGVLDALKVAEDRARLEVGFGVGSSMDHIGYLPLVPSAIGKKNVLLGDRTKYIEFVRKAPLIDLPSNNNIRVEAENYDDVVNLLREELKILREKLDSALEKKSKRKGRVRSLLGEFGEGVVSVIEFVCERAVAAFLFG